jgi:ferredoxin
MKKYYIISLSNFVLLNILLLVFTADAQDRFPRPEFQSGYEIPPNNLGDARAVFLYYIDVAALLAALCAAVWLVHKKRSRKGVTALMLLSVAYFGFYKKGCICSIGAIQNVTAGIFSDYAVPASVFLIFILPLVFALFFGRVFCSGVCPIGALQDFAAICAKKIPARLAALLKIVPHIYLGIRILFAAPGGGFPICKLDPIVGGFRLGAPSSMILWGALLLLTGVFAARPYCRFLCPYGLLLGAASLVSKYRVKICSGACANCGLCENACPVDAILPPTTEPVTEPRGKSVKRLKIYAALLPLWIAAGAAAGWLSSEPVSSFHPDVKLLRLIEREESGAALDKSIEGEALRVDADVIAVLKTRSDAAQKKFRLGLLLLGAYIGIIIGGYLIRQSVYRKRNAYETDPFYCVNCGRCYGYCPKNR